VARMLNPDLMQFVPLIVWYILTVIPVYIIIRRTGKPKWLAIFLVLPIAGFAIVIWTLAYTRWPTVSRAT
jgi:hypothetical protein